ncbi:MAG: hypothetical protein V4735_00010 [Pseudomonadota bacterium]
MTEENKYDADALSRVIMLLYGQMDHGGPFWCYVAVKPSQFDAFKAAEAGGAIDLYNFEAYGEVIVSAEGKTPPEDVTLKVAEMYGADASTFFQPIDPIAEIGRKIDQLKAQDGAE